MNPLKIFDAPAHIPPENRQNFRYVGIDAIGVGLASAAAPFLPVYLTRMNASSFEVGLLSSMPAITGLLLALPLGQFLQNQKQIVPWFSRARLLVLLSYAFTGIAGFFMPESVVVKVILLIWALATIPQTALNITFSVVMNAIAGPNGRYDLMTRRWSILGLTTSLTVLAFGQFLDRVPFPLNYQLMFLVLSAGGWISYYYSSHIVLEDIQSHVDSGKKSAWQNLRESFHLIRAEKPFMSFVSKRFVFLTGTAMVTPLFPLYFVRELHAPDSWIAAINTASTAILILGYFIWSMQSRKRGARFVIVLTTLGASLYPIVTALTHEVWPVAIYAGIAGIFQAGLNLVLFDELMRTIPPEYSSTFVAAAQGLQYLSSIFAPIIGTTLGEWAGLSTALILGGVISLVGFMMFLLDHKRPAPNERPA